MGSKNTWFLLIIEDDLIDQKAIIRWVKSNALPYQCTFASSLAEAKKHLENTTFDLVLTDYNLGDGKALELAPYFQKLPFIFTTGQGDQAIAVQALKAGAIDYLVKDLGHNYLQFLGAAVEKALRHWEEKEKLRLLESVVINANDAILITEATPLDLPGPRIIYANEGFTKMSGYSPEEVIGKTPRFTQGPDSQRSELDRIKAALKVGKGVKAELINYHRTGGSYWVDIHIIPVKNGQAEITHFISIQRDITQKKKEEIELIEAKDRAEKAEKAERRFLANMSHEIRNPIQAVGGMTNLLLKSEMDAKQLELVHAINYSSNLLSSLVSDILDFSKIESGEIHFEKKPIDLNHIIGNITKMYQFTLKGKEVSLNYKLNPQIPQVIGDLTRLNQILINLIGNAIKFTEVGEIKVRSHLIETSEEKCLIEFSVSDTGIGIPADELDAIFIRFKQSRNSINKGIGGTGLGLAIASQLVLLQGGKIWAESKEGQGSTFYFQLPFQLLNLKTSPSKKKITPTHSDQLFKHLNILVAEDNPMNQKLIQMLLDEWGVSYDMAADGKIALNLLNKKKKYDFALMDMHMPGLNGLECTQKLREGNSLNKDIPVIALTASLFAEDKKEANKKGISDILTKPFEPNELYQLIKQYSEPPTNNALLDLSYLQKVARSNNKFIVEMLQIFLNMTPEALLGLQLSLDKKDAAQLFQLAHKMRSTFRIIGNQELSQLIIMVDEACVEGDPDWAVIEKKIARVIQLCEQAIPEVEKALVSLNEAET